MWTISTPKGQHTLGFPGSSDSGLLVGTLEGCLGSGHEKCCSRGPWGFSPRWPLHLPDPDRLSLPVNCWTGTKTALEEEWHLVPSCSPASCVLLNSLVPTWSWSSWEPEPSGGSKKSAWCQTGGCRGPPASSGRIKIGTYAF